MNIAKSLWAVLTAVSACLAQTYNISGIVTDTGTTPLSGAVVKLEKAGLTATSGADGRFTLTGSVGIHSIPGRSVLQRSAVTFLNGLISFDLKEPGVVRVDVYSVQGRLLSRVQRTLGSGRQSLPVPQNGTGVYIYRVKIGEKTLDVRRVALGAIHNQGTDKMSAWGAVRQAMVTASINDVIAVTKEGRLNYRVVVYNPDTSNIQIKMIVCADTVRDIDGNLYQAVRIGNQVWTVENLRVTRYNDSTAIPFDSSYSNSTWAYATTQKYCFYKNTMIPDSIKKYGALYNWYVVNQSNPKEIAPAGWHIPTNAEWDTLQNYLIKNGYNWDGTTTGNTIAKSMAAKTDWMTDTSLGVIGNNLTKNNSSGFSALPGGYRSSAGGNFLSQGSFGNWWSVTAYTTTNAWGCGLTSNQDYLDRGDGNKGCGLSVRLVKD